MPVLECVQSEAKNGVRKLVFFAKPQIKLSQSSQPASSSQSSSQSTPPQEIEKTSQNISKISSQSPTKTRHASPQSSPKKQTQLLLSFGDTPTTGSQDSPKKLRLIRNHDNTVPIYTSGVLSILSLGTVEYARSSYHNYRYIYPIGYKAKRKYTSYKNVKDTTTYTMEILDGGANPIFRVTAKDDPKHIFSSEAPSGCCMDVVRRIDEARLEKRHNVTVSGPSFFGFADEKVRNMIYNLPNAEKCAMYSHKRIKPPPSAGAKRTSGSTRVSRMGGGQPSRKKMRFAISGQFGGMFEESYDDDVITVTVVNTSAAKQIAPLLHDSVITTRVMEDELETIITVFDDQVNSPQIKTVPNILDFAVPSLGKFSAVLIDPPWHEITPQDLLKLDMYGMTYKEAYLFIWVEKKYISDTLRLIEKNWNFRYVENMCWVMERANQEFTMNESEFLATSHQTMLIFKKEPKKAKARMDIRHQRSPDVIFDFVDEQHPREKPRRVFGYLETLIPNGQFLELWGSHQNKQRKESRWVTIVQEGDK